MSQKDPLAIGLGALLCGVGLGGATITLVLVLVRAFQYLDLSRYGEAVSDASLDLLAALAGGITIAAVFGWRRSAPLGNLWQRGVIAALAPVGALIIAFVLAALVEYLFDLPGLVVLVLASAAAGVAGSRWSRRGAGEPGAEDGERSPTGEAAQ